MTDRIVVNKSSPSTQFVMEADIISQDIVNNKSILRVYVRAVNTGNTSSNSTYPGAQYFSVDGINPGSSHFGNPFLPSGFATNQQRWRDGPYDIDIPHLADGTRPDITIRMILDYDGGAVSNENYTAVISGIPRIPRGPRVKDAGTWKNTIAYVKDAGVWKIAIPYVKDAGTWKIGGG